MKSKFICIVFICLCIAFAFPKTSSAQINFNNWLNTTNTLHNVAGTYITTHNNTLYVLGGAGYTWTIGEYSNINNDGSLGQWNNISATPSKYWHAGAIKDDYTYLIGGNNTDYQATNTVVMGKIESNGDILEWKEVAGLPKTLVLPAATIVGDRLYVAGGNVLNTDHTNNLTNQDIYMALININDGTLGDWSVVGLLPYPMMGFGMLEIDNYLYIFGGKIPNDTNTNEVKRAYINNDGTLLGWSDQPTLPIPFWRTAITRVGNTLITAGGEYGTWPYNYAIDNVYYSFVLPDGQISEWNTGPSLPLVNCCSSATSWNDYIYLVGGHDEVNYYNSVLFSHISTPVPVTKTVFAPGLMASWNTEAILNCSSETNTEWTLAPYAKSVYEPIYQALNESGWTTLPFYYDWRQKISDNSQELANFIDKNTSSEEKVNLVGHSMGGLVGRGYLDASEGGKLASLLAVGTPNKGSAYSYYPWEGGEILRNSLIEKIALTLYVKHCSENPITDRQTIQENVPSLQDLLPTDAYLQKENDSILYLPASEKNQNNWIDTLSSNNYGIKLGYLAGIGNKTIKTIITTDPKKKDIKNGDWEDGRPSGETLSEEGDGTVLLSSATLPDIPEENAYVINQDHRSLINSVEGMSKVLEFLGNPESTITEASTLNLQSEPNSALIIIGYPADFIITDNSGEIKSDDDGMIALMNPKSGNYKVNLLSKSNETLFIVAQFLPNGDVKYKEYKFKGIGPKFKTLKFDLRNPKEDILE